MDYPELAKGIAEFHYTENKEVVCKCGWRIAKTDSVLELFHRIDHLEEIAKATLKKEGQVVST